MPRRFKSKEAYRKYAAYIHIHDIPHTPGEEVTIAGKRHKPAVSEAEKRCSKVGYCKAHRMVHY